MHRHVLTSTEFQARPAEALDRAMTHHVVIKRHGRPRNVVLSYEEYERLVARDRVAILSVDAPTEDVEAILSARMEPGHEHLNGLLPEGDA